LVYATLGRLHALFLFSVTGGMLVPAMLMATLHSYENGQNLILTESNPLTDYGKTLQN